MLELNWSDVISTLTQIKWYLIAIGIIIGVAIVVNLICTGPLYTLLSLASGTGVLTEESIVLLKNEDRALPLTSGLDTSGASL